jgi:hypothetical protein
MQGAVHVVVDSRDHGNLKMISCEYLWRLINVNVSLFPVFIDVVLHLVEVNIWRPTVNINDSQEQVLCRHHNFFKLLLQMLGAP